MECLPHCKNYKHLHLQSLQPSSPTPSLLILQLLFTPCSLCSSLLRLCCAGPAEKMWGFARNGLDELTNQRFNHETWDFSNITSMKLGIFKWARHPGEPRFRRRNLTREMKMPCGWSKWFSWRTMVNHGEPWRTILAKIDMPQDSPEDHSMGNLNHP